MAKCVQVVGQGIPIRVSDDFAIQLVRRDLDASYCPKRVWREFYKTHGREDTNPHRPGSSYTAPKGRR